LTGGIQTGGKQLDKGRHAEETDKLDHPAGSPLDLGSIVREEQGHCASGLPTRDSVSLNA